MGLCLCEYGNQAGESLSTARSGLGGGIPRAGPIPPLLLTCSQQIPDWSLCAGHSSHRVHSHPLPVCDSQGRAWPPPPVNSQAWTSGRASIRSRPTLFTHPVPLSTCSPSVSVTQASPGHDFRVLVHPQSGLSFISFSSHLNLFQPKIHQLPSLPQRPGW